MRTFLALLIGVIALLIGYFSHQAIHPSSTPGTQVSLKTEVTEHTRILNSQRRVVNRALGIPESTQRWLRIVALLEKATLSDMRGIAESAGFSDERITQMIGQHWFDLDPQHLFETSTAELKNTPRGQRANFACYAYLRLLARKWPGKNLEDAIATFSQPDPKNLLADYKDEFVEYLIKVDLGRAIKLSKDWDYRLRDSYGLLKEVVENDPVKAAHAILSGYQSAFTHHQQTQDPFSRQPLANKGGRLLDVIAEVWGKTDPATALAFASSFKTNQGFYLQQKVLEQWARNDDTAAGHWLNQQAEDIQDQFRPTLIKAWATEDPQGALAWCQEHLEDPTAYQTALKSLINGALEGDLTKASELLPKIPDLVHQQTILRKVASSRFTPNKEGDISAASINWLREFGDSPLGIRAIEAASYNWSSYDPESMKAFFEEERDFDYPISAYNQLIKKLIDQNPASALEWTTGLARQSEYASSRAVNHWLIQAPEAAITWLRESQEHTPSHEIMHEFLSSFVTYKDATDTMLPKLSPENKAWLSEQYPEKR